MASWCPGQNNRVLTTTFGSPPPPPLPLPVQPVAVPVGTKEAGPVAPPPQPTIVPGLDTPCHRSAVRAYRSCARQVEEGMAGAVRRCASTCGSWAKDEALWRKTWGSLLEQVEGL